MKAIESGREFSYHSGMGTKDGYLAPSLLAADFSDLKGALKYAEENGGDYIHIDVMDGKFVPEISFGQVVISSIRPLTKLPFDVHLMIERPENAIQSFVDCGSDFITFHIEATSHADRIIQMIHSAGKKAGVALCPATPAAAVRELLSSADIVLVMTVNPGWGGQHLIPYTLEKVKELADIRDGKGFKYLISVDGGINRETVKAARDAGADIIVSGTSFFTGNLGWKQ